MKPRILVVEDDDVLRRPLQRTLEAKGYDVLAVTTAEDALASLAATSVHLVVTDRGLPGMDGGALIRQLHLAHPELPVLLITGQPGSARGDEPRPFATLRKPFDPEQLLALIQQGLQCVEGPSQGGVHA